MNIPARLATSLARAMRAATEGRRTKLDVEFEGLQLRIIVQPKPDFQARLRERQSAEAH